MDEKPEVYIEVFERLCILSISDPMDHVILKPGRPHPAVLREGWYHILDWPGYGIPDHTVHARKDLSPSHPRRIKVTKP